MKKKSIERGAQLRLAEMSLAGVLVCFATGCASVGAPERVSSLGQDISLQLQADGAKSWRSGQTQRYQAVHIDPAAIAFDSAVLLEPAQRQELREAMVTALSARFAAAGWRLLQAPGGADSLTIKAAITDVQLANTAANILTTALLIGPLSHGGVTVEIQAQDSSNQQPVAALAFKGRAGIEDLASAYSATGHARLQADGVAQRFVQLLANKEPSHGATR